MGMFDSLFDQSPIFGGDGQNYADPKTMTALAMLTGLGQGAATATRAQVTPWGLRKPGLLEMLAGMTSVGAQGALTGPMLAQRYGMGEQQTEAAKTKNALDKITLGYYQRKNAPGSAPAAITGSMPPSAGRPAQAAASDAMGLWDPKRAADFDAALTPEMRTLLKAAPDITNMGDRGGAGSGGAAAPPMSYGAPMPAPPAPQAGPGGAPMLFDPRSLAAQYAELSSIPGMSAQAAQILTLIEKMQEKGGGFTATGGYATVPGFNDARQATKRAETMGETQGKPPERKDIIRGDRTVTQQFNPATWQFEDVAGAGGPRWEPDRTIQEISDGKGGSIFVPRAQAIGKAGTPAAPTVRRTLRGDTEVDQQWDPVKREWADIGSGPRFQPDRVLQPYYNPDSPTGTTLGTREDALGKPGAPQTGLRVQHNPDGGFTIENGPVKPGKQEDPSGLAKPTITEIEKELLNGNLRLDRLNAIEQRFQPKFLEYGTQLNQAFNAVKEKAGIKLPPAQEKMLAEYTAFRSDAYNDLNRTLKEMSGAAVTEQESARLLKTIADAKGDSPTEFMTKLKGTQQSVRMAQARLGYIRTQGMNGNNDFGGLSIDQIGKKVPLDAVPGLIDKRGAEIERTLKADPSIDPSTIRRRVGEQLGQEFGIPM